MSQTAKPNKTAAQSAENSSGVDIDALEETVQEVVETLDVTVQAAEFVQASSPDARMRARAARIQQRAEAMLDAARKRPNPKPRRTLH